MNIRHSWLAFWLAASSTLPSLIQAQTAGSIVEVGDTLVSAMMLFVGNDQKVYILDKVEGNPTTINGHPAWGSVWDLASNTATTLDIETNVFCASGMHLPNGSFVTFGGNDAIGPGGNTSTVAPDATYKDFDGRQAIRILNPCTGDIGTRPECQWVDPPGGMTMQKRRWYSAAEPLGDGSIAIIGGFVNGGYVNRNFPNTDPATEGGAAEPTYEFFPPKGAPQVMQFMIDTSGLNSYAHTFLMSSGRMFLQANLSSMLWDPLANTETRLPDMPNGIARVYPASGGVAMLPLLPSNNYSQTVLFCGGTDMPADDYGDYANPRIDTWNYPASNDCHRITPENPDGTTGDYIKDDDMLETRTMGQFIALPDGTLLMVNGGNNGTAGYAQKTGQTADFGKMPFGMSLASGPVFTPAIYNPKADPGKRWSNTGLSASKIPRLYHSSAILLPDGSVMIAGSNPNVDVNMTTAFPTTYRAEIFYPPYFAAKTRPAPTGLPTTLSYGGPSFDVTIPASSYSGSANDAADNSTVMLMRPGFTTHAMNMGQRALQLNNTYTVNKDGSITLHVSQVPPNPNLLQPGPVLMFVTVNGIPSKGTTVIVGNGQIGTQPTAQAQPLPAKVRLDSATGSAGGKNGNTSSTTSHTGLIVGGIIAAIAVVGILGAGIGVCLARRRRAEAQAGIKRRISHSRIARGLDPNGGGAPATAMRSSESSAFVPLAQNNQSAAWDESHPSLLPPHSGGGMHSPYRDYRTGSPAAMDSQQEFDAYNQQPVRYVGGGGGGGYQYAGGGGGGGYGYADYQGQRH